MPYDVSIEERESHIRVVVSGDRIPGKEVEDGKRVWRRVAEICHETRTNKVLAFVRLSGRLPIMGSFEMAGSLDQIGWSRSFKLAIVEENEESRKGSLFTETVAVNRGYRVKVFANEESATTWL